MGHKCAFGCKASDAALHSFPNPKKYPEHFRVWVNIVGEQLETLSDREIYAKKRICDIHFLDEHRNRFKRLNILAVPSLHLPPKPMLKKNAVPSIFPIHTTQRVRYKTQKRQIQINKGENDHETKKEVKLRRISQHGSNGMEMCDLLPFECVEVEMSNENNLSLPSNDNENRSEVEDRKSDVGVQCNICDINGHNQFSIEYIMDTQNPVEVHFYTGFQNYEQFKHIFNLFGDEVNNLMSHKDSTTEKPYNLSPIHEFLLTVIKLWRNTLFLELSFRFKINQNLVSDIFVTWINYLFCKFNNLSLWAPKRLIDQSLQDEGREVVIDCTEIKIEKPKDSNLHQLTYSTFKSCNTVKVLIGISESGFVTFSSEAFNGSVSDQEMLIKCDQLSRIQTEDISLSGFNTQVFICKKEMDSEKYTPNKVHAERLVELAKTFKILSGKLNTKLVPLADRIVYVCFMLSHFKSL